METESKPVGRFNQRVLPWIAAAGALVVYLVTLNHWVTVASLPLVAKVTGWDWWMPTLQAPVYLLVTYPVRWLAPGAQPVALNFFAALCGAGALGLLARSVALLPHDRTIQQRQRERHSQGLLSIPANWLPPLLAALSLGLTLTFWEHAVVATGEAFNVLLFAYVIRCLLEFRIQQKESWLLRMAFVYGLAVTNNWAMIGFFPLFLAAVVWIKGAAFFNWRFLGKMTGCGLLGLLPCLFLPAVQVATSAASNSFWEYLRFELVLQRNSLLLVPRWLVLILSLSSVLPVIAMGIRWPSHAGDISATGTLITQLMFHVLHALFLVAGAAVMFDPRFSPRSLAGAVGIGVPFLTFYYLSALSVGYFSGYFLLVFGPDAGKTWKRPSLPLRLVSGCFVAAIWLGLVGIPVALAYRNLPSIQGNNGPALRQFAAQLARNLPETGAIVLSDNPFYALLLQAHYGSADAGNPHVVLDTRSLSYLSYHRTLAKRYPDKWKDWSAGKNVAESVNPSILVSLLLSLSSSHALYYLHPSFGYYFENFHLAPRGLVHQLKPYPPKAVAPPLLSPEEIKLNLETWAAMSGQFGPLASAIQRKTTDAMVAGRFYARALNHWGVVLQRNGRHQEARAAFAQAVALHPDNRAARINLEAGDALLQRKHPMVESLKAKKDILGAHRSWDSAMNEFGPYSEPRLCFDVGRNFVQGGLPRQGVIEFIHARTLDPTNLTYRVAEAEIYLQGNLPDETLDTLKAIRKLPAAATLDQTNQFALIRLEAMAHLGKTNFAAAEKLVLDARRKFPQQPAVLETLAQVYMLSSRFNDALATLDQQLKAFPNDASPLMNKAAVHFRLKAYEPCIAALDAFLKKQPQHLLALELRAAANLQLKRMDAAKADYEAIRKLAPKAPAAHFSLGELAFQQKQTRDAITHYEAFLKLVSPDAKEAAQARERLRELKAAR